MMCRSTLNEHALDGCLSALPKAIRQRNEDLAMYCTAENCLHKRGEDGSDSVLTPVNLTAARFILYPVVSICILPSVKGPHRAVVRTCLGRHQPAS